MFKKLIFPIAGVTVATGLYFQKQQIPLNNATLRTVLQLLHSQNVKYSAFLLKNMIRFCMIKQCPQMSSYVFNDGFDFDAVYIDGLMQIGFDTVEIGPLSLIPSCSEEERMHFGSATALGNINVFYEQKALESSSKPHSKVGISITPNFQIIKYAPYLIEQNMVNCIKEFQQLNEGSQSLKIHRYILKLTDPQIKAMQTSEYLTLIKSLITNAHKALDSTIQATKQQLTSAHLSKPQVFVEIPQKSDNPKLYETVTALPQVRHLIIGGAEFNVQRVTEKVDKKVVEKMQLALGKRRLSFSELLDKVVHDSL